MKTAGRMGWVGLALVVAVGAPVAGYAYLRFEARSGWEAARRSQEASWNGSGQAFLRDAEYAATLTWLKRDGTRDAGPQLNRRLSWNGAGAQVTGGFALDRARADKLGKDWLDADAAVLEGVDLGWMDTLGEFDFWDLETGTPLEGVNTARLLAAPLPDLLPLVAWAKLRLLQGLLRGDPAGAGGAVRELARLCLSTEMLLPAMVGVAVLKVEDEARHRAVAKGQGAWKTLDEGERERLRRMLKGMPALVSPLAPAEAAAEFGNVRVGRCLALNEVGPLYLGMRPMLHGERPELFSRFEGKLRLATECRLPRLRRDWARPVSGDDPPLGAMCSSDDKGDPVCQWVPALLWIPGSRALLGDLLLAVAAPDPLRGYPGQP